MRKIILITLMLLLTASLVSATDYYVDVKPGWNLLYGDTTSYDSNDNAIVKYRYVNPVDKNILEFVKKEVAEEKKDYYSLSKEDEAKIMDACGDYDCGEYFEDDASWVYFENSERLQLTFSSQPITMERGKSLGIRLFSGWNVKTFMPMMFATGNGNFATIDDFKGDCNVEAVEVYDPETESWIDYQNRRFYKDFIMRGIAIKVSNDCELKASESYQQESAEETGIPTEFVYTGTKYINCHPNPLFPVSVNKEITTLSGKVESEQGSQSAPYNIAKINDLYLFDESTGKPLSNFKEMLGEKVKLNGYQDTGAIIGTSWWEDERKEYTIKEVDAFFVTDINGWQNVCCDATSGDSGIVSSPNVCRWFSIKDFYSQIQESNEGLPKELEIKT